MFVGSDAGDNDEVLFSALEGIHAADLHRLIQCGLEWTLPLHDGNNVASLPFVGSDDSYLPRSYARL